MAGRKVAQFPTCHLNFEETAIHQMAIPRGVNCKPDFIRASAVQERHFCGKSATLDHHPNEYRRMCEHEGRRVRFGVVRRKNPAQIHSLAVAMRYWHLGVAALTELSRTLSRGHPDQKLQSSGGWGLQNIRRDCTRGEKRIMLVQNSTPILPDHVLSDAGSTNIEHFLSSVHRASDRMDDWVYGHHGNGIPRNITSVRSRPNSIDPEQSR